MMLHGNFMWILQKTIRTKVKCVGWIIGNTWFDFCGPWEHTEVGCGMTLWRELVWRDDIWRDGIQRNPGALCSPQTFSQFTSKWIPCSPPSCIVRGDEVLSARKGQDEQVLDNACAHLQALKEPEVPHWKQLFPVGIFPELFEASSSWKGYFWNLTSTIWRTINVPGRWKKRFFPEFRYRC